MTIYVSDFELDAENVQVDQGSAVAQDDREFWKDRRKRSSRIPTLRRRSSLTLCHKVSSAIFRRQVTKLKDQYLATRSLRLVRGCMGCPHRLTRKIGFTVRSLASDLVRRRCNCS